MLRGQSAGNNSEVDLGIGTVLLLLTILGQGVHDPLWSPPTDFRVIQFGAAGVPGCAHYAKKPSPQLLLPIQGRQEK